MTTRTIDTNILVRLLVDDHSQQTEIAARVAAEFRLVIYPAVMLETEWVLRSRYRLSRAEIYALFQRVLEFDGFAIVERERMNRAVWGFGSGMDFADALHICLMPEGETFLTFDRDLVKHAKQHFSHLTVELAH